MSELNNMNNYLFDLVKKNIKVFLIVGIVAVIASVIFSSSTFIEPKFKSTAVIYPSNLGRYSEESPIEQMIQWFDSRMIKESVIKDFDLATHYEIDVETDKLGEHYLFLTYDENVKISETKYESAMISVTDIDPEIAFNMVNANIKYFNQLVREVHLKRAKEDFKAIKYRYEMILSQLDSLGYKGQLSLNEDENYITHSDRVTNLLREYVKMNEDYHYLQTIINNNKTYTNTIVEPYISQKKVYPIRWLIVLFSAFFSVFFTFIVLLFVKKIKQ